MQPDLKTAAGRDELERAITVARSITETDPVRRAGRLRALLEPELATLALSQSVLRARAQDKFGPAAERMFFTVAGLEQASRTEVADHRAARFAARPPAAAGPVLDLCCGIGGDLLAFARAGLAGHGVDRDPATVELARANLAGFPGVDVSVGAAEDAHWQAAAAVFLDPARRTGQVRHFDPAAYSPSYDFVRLVLAESPWSAAKLAPGLDHGLIPDGVEAEWVSYRHGVKETVLWSAAFAEYAASTGSASSAGSAVSAPSPVRRRATMLPSARQLTDTDPAQSAVGALGDYVYEPDGAIIRAGLVQQLAARLPGGRRLDEHLAYLTADGRLADGDASMARGYRVLDVLDYSVKRLATELRRRQIGIAEIKKRGVDIDPAVLRRRLNLAGTESITVLLARVGHRRLAILAQPIELQADPVQDSEPDVPGTIG
ncbi:MAG: cytosine methyltransferase [Frankiales bacterium]|nr:cytosine methyltransferase [Frankiales bacterium]